MLEQKRILILDDEQEILDLLKMVLGKTYTVLGLSTIHEFEQKLVEFRPNVVMIDHFIGEETSNIIVHELLRNMNIPTIIHSAHEEVEKLYVQSKADAYIKKPSSIQEIRRTVATVLEKENNPES